MNKRLISMLTALSIVLGMFGTFTVFADETAADLEISTLAELEQFRDSVNAGNSYEGKTIKLTADIEASSKYGEYKNSWTPIGIGDGNFSPEAENVFAGTFDGGGHLISNIYIYYESEMSSDTVVGFFGINTGTIKNLTVEGEYTNLNGRCTGGIAGGNFGHIEQCAFIGNVTCQNNSGGITGGNCGTIESCYNTASIITFNCGGGIAGSNDGGTIMRCYNIGKVYVGRAFADVEEESQWLGSLCAGSANSVIDCYYLTGTCKSGVYTFSEEEEDGGTELTLEQFADKSNFNGWDFENIWEIDPDVKLQKPVFRSRYIPPSITEIYTAEDLKEFRDSVNSGNTYDGKTVKLMNDIELDINEAWLPIGGARRTDYQRNSAAILPVRAFSGVFDGQNYTISGLNISECFGSAEVTFDDGHQGFFGCIDGAELKNLNLRGIMQKGVYMGDECSNSTYAGAVAGEAQYSDIHDVNSYVDIYLDNIDYYRICIGGITGNLKYYSYIYDCNNYGSISVINDDPSKSAGDIGGIACDIGSYSYIDSCANYGDITVVGNSVTGGINGIMHSRTGIDDCINHGKISVTSTGNGYVGGIVGALYSSAGDDITHCLNIGKMDCSTACKKAVGPIGGSTRGDEAQLVDNYYLDTSVDTEIENSGQGTSVAKTAEELASGEVAYLLNGKKSDGNSLRWYQTIGEDEYPTLDKTHLVVWYITERYYNHIHTPVHHEAVPASCTEAGTGEYWVCEGTDGCGKMFSDANGTKEITKIPIISAGHSWSDWEITKEPTETEEGAFTRVCSKCGEAETEPIPVLEYFVDYYEGEAYVFVTHDDTYTVIFASYDDDGVLLSVDVQNIWLSKDKNAPISPKNFNADGKVRVMLWESLETMKPLAMSGE